MQESSRHAISLSERECPNAPIPQDFFEQKLGCQRPVDRLRSKAYPSRLEVGWVWGVKTSRQGEALSHPSTIE